jgi:hypothetical protein
MDYELTQVEVLAYEQDLAEKKAATKESRENLGGNKPADKGNHNRLRIRLQRVHQERRT